MATKFFGRAPRCHATHRYDGAPTGSLLLGRAPATGTTRTLQVGDNPTRLAQAIAEFGWIDKTLHTLNMIDDENKRRSTLTQLNRGEGRHSLGRAILHGKRGELRQRYREGQEDQLGALGKKTVSGAILRKSDDIRPVNLVSLQAQLIEGSLHVDGVPKDDHVNNRRSRPTIA